MGFDSIFSQRTSHINVVVFRTDKEMELDSIMILTFKENRGITASFGKTKKFTSTLIELKI